MFNICVFVSGRGSNLRALIEASRGDVIRSEIVLVLSNKKDAKALQIAEEFEIPHHCIADMEEDEVLSLLRGIDLIVLAGYTKILSEKMVSAFRGRIINIHPSLIPLHCGKGYYGMRVHESVISSKDAKSGATVHFVDEGVDTGAILLQESVEVNGKSAGELAEEVLRIEHRILPEAIAMLERGGLGNESVTERI